MFWFVFTFFVISLAYLGSRSYPQNVYARICLIFVLSYAVSLCSESQDQNNYLIGYNNSIPFYNFSDILHALSIFSDYVEPGYIVICKLCRSAMLSGKGMLFVMAVLTNTFIVSFFYKSRYPVLAFIILISSVYFMQQTNLVRQMLAVAIVTYSLQFVEKRNIKLFLLCIFVAYSIHRSALVFCVFGLFIFLDNTKIEKINKILLWCWIFSILSAMGFSPITKIPLLTYYLSGTDYYSYLSDSESIGIEKHVFDWLYNLLILILCVYRYNYLKNSVYYILFVSGGILSNITINMVVLGRMNLYFVPLYCVLLPIIIVDNRFLIKNRSINNIVVILFFYRFLHILFTRMRNGFDLIGGHVGSLMEIFA